MNTTHAHDTHTTDHHTTGDNDMTNNTTHNERTIVDDERNNNDARDAALALDAMRVGVIAHAADIKHNGDAAFTFLNDVYDAVIEQLDEQAAWVRATSGRDDDDYEWVLNIAATVGDNAATWAMPYFGDIVDAWGGLFGWEYDDELDELGFDVAGPEWGTSTIRRMRVALAHVGTMFAETMFETMNGAWSPATDDDGWDDAANDTSPCYACGAAVVMYDDTCHVCGKDNLDPYATQRRVERTQRRREAATDALKAATATWYTAHTTHGPRHADTINAYAAMIDADDAWRTAWAWNDDDIRAAG